MQDKSDHTLIKKYLDGDIAAFGVLYDKYAVSLFCYLRGMVREADAEDILHDVFIKVSKALENYEEKGRFKSWLFTVARSKALDFIRKKQNRNEKYLNEASYGLIAGKERMPDELESGKEIKMMIKDALNDIPEMQREVFLLREDSGLSFKEIAEALDIPVNTALSHMHRATENLRDRLISLGVEAPY